MLIVGCMAVVLFGTTGAEHSLATWIPTYGERVGGLGLV